MVFLHLTQLVIVCQVLLQHAAQIFIDTLMFFVGPSGGMSPKLLWKGENYRSLDPLFFRDRVK